MARPTTCVYCDGKGNSTAGGKCGFCKDGKPLDTQEDWNRTWGRVLPPRNPTKHEEEQDD